MAAVAQPVHSPDDEKVEQMFHGIAESKMAIFLKSLHLLDQPCMPFEELVKSRADLMKYREDDEVARSPRDFMQRLRVRYQHDHTENNPHAMYCRETHRWMTDDMQHVLGIEYFAEHWFIPVEHLETPTGFQAFKVDKKHVPELLPPENKQPLPSWMSGTPWAGGRTRSKRYRYTMGFQQSGGIRVNPMYDF